MWHLVDIQLSGLTTHSSESGLNLRIWSARFGVWVLGFRVVKWVEAFLKFHEELGDLVQAFLKLHIPGFANLWPESLPFLLPLMSQVPLTQW